MLGDRLMWDMLVPKWLLTSDKHDMSRLSHK